MKIILKIAVVALLFAACTSAPKETRLMTYNIHNGIGMDTITDYKRIAEVIKQANPDVVAIQEIDSVTQRSQGLFVLAEIAKHIDGIHYTFNASIPYSGGKYGIGILSKEKPVKVKAAALPGREEQRSVVITEFKDYVFCCTHLSLNAEDRLASVAVINKETAEFGNKPVFLGGDLNAAPSSAPMTEFFKSWTPLNDTAVHTIPVVNPRRCIDYLLVKNPTKTEVLKAVVIDERVASDHLPVYVDIKY